MKEDLLIIQLRDCFTAGYTLPQFCRDNNIKKPLFIAIDERRADFLWEIYVQFKYDKKISPKFALINGKVGSLSFSVNNILRGLYFENIGNINLNDYDCMIVLNAIRLNIKNPRIIYLDQLKNYFITRTYAEIPLLHFLQRHPKVKLIVTNYPELKPSNNNTDFEKEILNSRKMIGDIRKEINSSIGEIISTPYDQFGYSNSEVYEMLELTGSKNKLDGSTVLEDTQGDLVKICNGKRMTAYQPENYVNKIYFIGTCPYFGIGAPFEKTIESNLQRMLNESRLPYRVENESQFFNGRQQDIFYNLNNFEVRAGDIIFLCLQTLLPLNIPSIDLRDMFKRPHNYGEVFADAQHHLNEIGYKVWAEKIFQFLVQNNFFKNTKIEYPYPPPCRIVTVFLMKIFPPRQTFWTTKIWKRTKNLCVNTALKSVA